MENFKFTPPKYDEVAEEGFAKLDELASGAARPSEPSAQFVQTEVSGNPSCHVCGQIMVPCQNTVNGEVTSRWFACVKCGADTRCSEPSAPLYSEQELKEEGLQATTTNYGKEGAATMYSAAPQTSAESWEKCVKEGPDCDCVKVCKFDAPQPVSGDAPKVEERTTIQVLAFDICTALAATKSNNGWMEIVLKFLRPYFPKDKE